MKALIMAGGRGSRMNYRNKSMLNIFGKPMIWYMVNALRDAEIDCIICATGDKDTASYLARDNVYIIKTGGKGYSQDLRYALEIIRDQVLVTPVDLPLLNGKVIKHIIEKSRLYNKACISVMVKKMFLDALNINNKFCKLHNGKEVCYTGISIIDARRLDDMEEDLMVIDDYRLALNVNTEDELRLLSIFKDYLIALQSRRKC